MRQDKQLVVFPIASTIGVLIVLFVNSALLSAAIIRLEGGDPTLGDGLRGATLRGIYSAALYEYAVGGATRAFDKELLATAFQPKPSRRGI